MRSHRPVAVLVALLAAVSLAACSSSSDGDGDETGARNTDATEVTTSTAAVTTTEAPAGESVVDAACAGTIGDPEHVAVHARPVVEASGVAVSGQNDDVLWVHNDSGDTARVFALGEDGRRLGTFRLAGAQATDWEDMAIGPAASADQDALYLADIGDNDAVRSSVTIYRVLEPEVATGSTAARATLGGVEAYPFAYPDGPRDAEALFIDRTADSFYVIEKSLAGGRVGIYRGPLSGWNADAAALPTLERVGTLTLAAGPANAVTGADMTPSGDAIAVRTYGGVLLWTRPDGTDVADVLAGPPCEGPTPAEVQGEAIALFPDASAYVTLPEGAAPNLSIWRP